MGKSDENEETSTREETERSRPARKATYERRLKTQIPVEIVELFAEQGLAVQYQLYRLANVVQQSSLAELLRDGWDFVTTKDLPEWYSDYFELEDYKGRQEILVAHDLVLMKHSVEYVESKKKFYEDQTAREIASVDTNILEKKGFITKGSKSSVTMAEPRFKE